MNVRLEHTRVGEWPAILLENDALRLVVFPQLGGKIVSLQSLRSGREWLWSNPHLTLTKPPHGPAGFGQYDSGGWDEIFPTVDPCTVPDSVWGHRRLTDHGELWCRPWEIIEATSGEDGTATLTLAVHDADLPFQFMRSLSLGAESGQLQVDYQVANGSNAPLPYIWAAHPLVAIRPGDEIVLPPGTVMSSTGHVGLSLAADALPFAWPHLRLASGELVDLSKIPECSAAFAIKLFAERVTPPAIEIRDQAGGERLRFSFTRPVVHCGLWLNYGAWSGAGTPPYFNLGIEPTTSPCDSLAFATARETAHLIPPQECHTWSLEVAVRNFDR